MKDAAIICLLLLISYQVSQLPSGLQVGEGIIRAQAEYEARMAEAHYKRLAQERQQEAEATRRQETAQAQAEFDALPKADPFGRPLNRVPPPGLSPTPGAPVPPPPVPITPRPTPDPRASMKDIEKKYGAK